MQQGKDLDSLNMLQENLPFFNLSLEQARICFEEGIDLNGLFLLEGFNEGTDLTMHYNHNKFLGYKQTLIRKGLIDERGIVLVKGKELLENVRKTISRKLERNIAKQEIAPFDVWWTTFPGTDTFEQNGRLYKGTRSLKTKKEECRVTYNKILNSGLYGQEELLNALKLEIQYKKEDSVKTGQNKLTYMKNSLTYLNQNAFEGFVELIRKNIKPKENNNTTEFGGFSI